MKWKYFLTGCIILIAITVACYAVYYSLAQIPSIGDGAIKTEPKEVAVNAHQQVRATQNGATEMKTAASTTRDPSIPGTFLSTYLPPGWRVAENSPGTFLIVSQDYETAVVNGTDICGDGGGIYCRSTNMEKGATYSILRYSCKAEGAAQAQVNWDTNEVSASKFFQSRQSIVIAGHRTTLLHARFNSESYPTTSLDTYRALVIAGDTCQEMSYTLTTTFSDKHVGELGKIFDGIQFVPDN
jgi:hypothetical protein